MSPATVPGAIHLTVPVVVGDRPPARAMALVLGATGDDQLDIVLVSDHVDEATDRWLVLLDSETDLGDPLGALLDTRTRVMAAALEDQIGCALPDAVDLVRSALDGVVFADRIGAPITDPATDSRSETDAWLVQQHAALEELGRASAPAPSLRERIAGLADAAGAIVFPARVDMLEVLSRTDVPRPRPAQLVVSDADRARWPDLRSRLVFSPGTIAISLSGLPAGGSVAVWALTRDGDVLDVRADLSSGAILLQLGWPDAEPPEEMVLAVWP